MQREGERPAGGFDLRLAEDDPASWDPAVGGGEHHSLVELVNRVLDKGVVITGDVTISVAGVDLVYLGLNAVLTSVSTARRVIDGRILSGGEERGPER
jgi:hypothetical protein